MPGFKAFTMLRRDAKAADDGYNYMSFTIWQDRLSFENWTKSQAFSKSHGGPPSQAGGGGSSSNGAGGSSSGHAHGGAQSSAHTATATAPATVCIQPCCLSYSAGVHACALVLVPLVCCNTQSMHAVHMPTENGCLPWEHVLHQTTVVGGFEGSAALFTP